MNTVSYLKKCLKLAVKGKGFTSPNPLVGCVVVKNGKILAEGYHHKFGGKHAETDALDKIKGKAKGSTLYVNLEPCSFKGKTGPCTERIIKEGISKVIFSSKDPNPKVKGKEVLKKAGIEINEGTLKEDEILLNQFFYKWIKTGLPYITLKIARTSDNFVAYPDGSCPEITNLKSRTFVHKMRAWYDAVLIGKGTAEKDNPSLTIRHVNGRQPVRVVLDSHGDLITSSKKILTDEHAKNTICVVGKNVKVPEKSKFQVIKCKIKNLNIDLNDLLPKLAKKNISSVLVEGGPHIWQSFLDENLADQIMLFTAKKKFGKGLPTLPKSDISKIKYKKAEVQNFGSDKLKQMHIRIY